MKKGQAAMEPLMIYGWAILVVLIAIGTLAYFGVFGPENFIPEKCVISKGSGLFCEEFTSSAGANGTVRIRIKNTFTESTWVDYVTLDSPACSVTPASPQLIAADGTSDFILACAGGLNSGDKIKGSITIKFDVGTSAGDGLSNSTTGQLVTSVP